MPSSETLQTPNLAMNPPGRMGSGASSPLAVLSMPTQDPDHFTIGELLTVVPAGSRFPHPLHLHVKVRCDGPESGYAQSVRASIGDFLTRASEAIRELLSDERNEVAEEFPTVIQFGEVEVNFRKQEVQRAGVPIDLTAHEFKTLRYFAIRPNTVISREELLNRVWGYPHYPTTRTVDNRILRLRRKLEPNPSKPAHFLTVHGVGYKFMP